MKDILLSVVYLAVVILIIRIGYIQMVWNFKYGHKLEDEGGTKGDHTVLNIIICLLSTSVSGITVTGCMAVLVVSQIIILLYIKRQNSIVYADDMERRNYYDREINRIFKRTIICFSALVLAILVLRLIL